MTTFRRHAPRRRWAAAATLILVPTLAACGFSAQTNQQYQSAAGTDSLQQTAELNASNSASPVQVYNAAVVIAKKGDTSGSFIGSFVNNTSPDALAGYDANGQYKNSGVTATVTSVAVGASAKATAIELAPNKAYHPGALGAGGDQPIAVTVPGDVADGGYVTMTFTILDKGTNTQHTVKMTNVPVFLADTHETFFGDYVAGGNADNTTTPSSTETE